MKSYLHTIGNLARGNLQAVQHFADFGGESGWSERFAQKVDRRFLDALTQDGVVGITRGEDHPDVGSALADAVREVLSVLAGHDDVGQNQRNGPLPIVLN